MEFEMQLQGFRELAESLRELPANVGKNMLRSAVGAGAAEIRKEAKQNAERIRKKGTLARSIYQKQIREQSGPERQTFYVGARQGKEYQKTGKKKVDKDAYYARFVELGHWSRPSGGGHISKRAGQRGREAELNKLSKAGHIRWVQARPFLRPAFDVKKDAAVTAMADKLRDRLRNYKAKTK